MKKVVIKFFLAVMCVMTVTATVAFADFTDMPSDPQSKAALELAVSNGLLTGYETGEIKPYDNIRRAEMAAIVVRAFGAKQTADISKFADMNSSQWYYDVMSKAVAMEVFQGDGVNLNPESYITFQEAFAVLARVFDLQTEYQIGNLKYELGLQETRPEGGYAALDKFSDRASVASWAETTTAAIVEGGYWNPSDMKLRPTDAINRTEFAILMNNLVTTYIDAPGTYDELPAGNIVVRSADVVINKFDSISSDIFVGDGVSGSTVTLGDNVNVDRLIIRGGKVLLGGSYNQVRMVGHNCVTDISYGPTVRIQLYSKYPNDSTITLGIKEF